MYSFLNIVYSHSKRDDAIMHDASAYILFIAALRFSLLSKISNPASLRYLQRDDGKITIFHTPLFSNSCWR